MTPETLYDALTNVKDALVDEAANPRMPVVKRRVNWLKWGSIAAAVVLVLGAGGWWAVSHMHMGSSAGGGGHEDGSTVFMSYAGPVFPLTALDGGEDLEARRELTYDFYRWTQDPQLVYADLQVTDTYTLQNPTGKDKTVTLLYPFVSSLVDLDRHYEHTPVLTSGEEELDTVLHAGGYSGGFEAPGGSNDTGLLLNLAQLNSWEQYKALLSDGRYLDAALGDFPNLSDIPVTVYKFTDAYGPEADSKADVPNPTIRAYFDLDYDKTLVLSYGFHGASWDRENSKMIQSFSIRRPGSRNYGEPYFLYVLGDDIQNLTTGGYVTGGTDEDTPVLDGCGVTVERYETDLESALREAAGLMFNWEDRETDGEQPDFELYFGLMKEFLCSYGPLSGKDVARYHTGWLEDMDFAAVDRVFYLEASVTIPAGGSVTLTAEMTREASYDYYCAHTENQDIYGYDMVTKLGSTLDFMSQTARTVNTDGLEIVRQNYGFDWANGVNEVTLDPSVEHYYLEVRRAAETE